MSADLTLDRPPAPLADSFELITVQRLATMSEAERDELPYGVVGMTPDGIATIYNATESRQAGLRPARVLAQHFFTAIAPCMTNDLVAGRFEAEATLDAVLPYVLSLRMRPTPVRLRLLRHPGQTLRFLLINRSVA